MPPARSIAHVSLLYLARHAGLSGFARSRYVTRLRRDRDAGNTGFNADGKLIAGLKADLQFGTAGAGVTEAVATVSPRLRGRYRALAPGLLTYLRAMPERLRCAPVSLSQPTVVVADLPIKLRAHLGVQHPDGSVEVVWFWCDEEPPKSETVALVHHLLAEHLELLHPAASRVVILDVRRGTRYEAPLGISGHNLDGFIASEAAAFRASWSAAAA
ncbi:hypothetical protein [Cryptosporangium phraense]|uniref:Uncharacterized protein n=1 Tax=Cryptosporangium phraense TaxID=2593070 RepID=A0A545AQY5_9ACTN|nr:hypothetical protein [Cryptosporangium phraense]TQS43727.1 hypothetical protein FL583_16950 [Cryptosporangium phraense]